ncbi:MAG: hypothetical protein B6244_05930 [Candidatus Cloacimonetes bacterium 4572_55]|nr:MAG: hypothetical protein B6244_05930 [Candidatus Cloacimonetes bacterium 4572_55]
MIMSHASSTFLTLLFCLGLSLFADAEANDSRSRQVHSPPFLIIADRAVRQTSIESVTNILHHYRKQVKEEWGWTPHGEVFVHIFSETWHYCQETGQPWEFGGIYQDQRLYLQSPELLEKRGRLKEIIVHEYIHLLIDQETSGNCPLWLNEGLAVFISEHRGDLAPPDLLMTPTCLDSLFIREPESGEIVSSSDLKQAYLSAQYYAAQLVQRYGIQNVRKILSNLGKDIEFDASFQHFLGQSVEEFINSCQKRP